VTLLVVDQDPTVGLMAKMTLGDHGFTVRSVDSAEAAAAAVAATRPDVVLLDLMLAGTDGYEACRRIRAGAPDHQLPILVATSLDDPGAIEEAYEEGATAFVTKPINWPVLRHQLRCVLRSSRDRARLAESEERYALAASGANDGLWDWDIAGDRVYFSPRWREQLHLREAGVGDRIEGWLARVHPDDQLDVRSALHAHLAGEAPKLKVEYRILDGGGRYRWMLCRALAIRDGDGNAYRMAGSQTDISDRKQAEEQLMHDALHDGLTGLANRRLLLEQVGHSIRLAQRRKDYHFAVVILDLDRFKNINDSLGHSAGDRLLCQMAERIAGHLRGSDTLARTGGDEFAILFDDIGEYAHLNGLIERIQHEISLPFTLHEQEVATSASIGITLSAPGYERAEDMLRDADIALYRAKALGKNRHELFNSGMHTQVSAMLRMESELRAALAHHEFRLHYQPIRRLSDDGIVGFEALLRWQHPQRGLLAPDAFLGLAEETGLIVPIGHWILREATRQLAAWRAAIPELRDTFVSVNLSSAEFADPDLLSHILAALDAGGLAASQLRLEVTETVLVQNTAQATSVLETLREHGVSTAIDDFGTGYSSLSYLLHFSFDALKIDRSFVQDLDRNTRCREIVRSIVGLAHGLGLTVIAEGGETGAEIERLREVGCELNQGFAFSAPLPAAEMQGLIQRHVVAAPQSGARPH
jgi:diguanylate cyclase (GGDEF)-like protein/PAS domain S-box-containing protein